MTIDIDSVWLDKGAHDGEDGGCLMEWTALIAGQKKNDQPTCTNLAITLHAQRLNDLLPDAERQRLKMFIPRLLRAKRTTKDKRVNVRLAVWAAREVLHLVAPEVKPDAEAAIAAAEGWLAGTVTEQECWEARRKLVEARRKYWATAEDAAAATAATAADAAFTADAVTAADAAAAAADAAADAADAAFASLRAWVNARIDFFDRLLDAHQKALAEEGVLLEGEFCEFAESLS